MKIIISILVLFISTSLISQTGDDGWNNRELTSYGNDVETARISITLKPDFNTEGHISFHAYIDPDIPFNGGIPVTDGEFNKNYIREFAPLKDNRTDIIPTHNGLDYSKWAESIRYFDGLGREIQQISVKGSPANTDIIQLIDYDDFGRQKQEYLPYPITQGGDKGPGGFRPDVITEQLYYYNCFYLNEQGITFAEKEFDNSPLNRVMKQSAPGESWKPNGGREIEFQYETITDTEVFLFTVISGNKLKKEGCYIENKLFKNITVDENDKVTIEYKDFQDRVVMKKSLCDGSQLRTYYVYDNFGKLRYILPPLSYVKLPSGTTSFTFDNDVDWILNLCYYYEYDDQKRMKLKRLPGAEAVYLVYNDRDQLVATQDGNLRQGNDWLFTKYDAFNRPVITGKYHHSESLSQEGMQGYVNDENNGFTLFENLGLQGYSNDAFPELTTDNCEYHSMTYYDNYDYP